MGISIGTRMIMKNNEEGTQGVLQPKTRREAEISRESGPLISARLGLDIKRLWLEGGSNWQLSCRLT